MAKLTIRFEIRQDKVNQEGMVPISCMISVSQNRKRIALEISVPACNWDKQAQRAIYLNKKQFSKVSDSKVSVFLMESDIDRINAILDKMQSKLSFIEDGFKLEGKNYSVQDVLDSYRKSGTSTGIKNQEKAKIALPTVPEFINTYIKRNKASRAKRSLCVYSQLQKHLEAFEKSSGTSVTFSRIGLSFFEEFQSFLIEERSTINNVTIAKQLSTLKTLLGYARKNGIEMNQSFRDFTIKRQKLEVITLSEWEYKTLKTADLKGVSRHEKARDIFIFLCATSMRYSDYAQFRREHIKGKTIQLTMKKGSKPWGIPLNADSVSILKKYSELEKPLPRISNQKLSKYIKEVCQKAGIDSPIEIVRFKGAEPIKKIYPKYKLISAHTGRKTFCTLSFERGASVEMVMEWSGHESYSSFKRYVNLSKEHSVSQMEKIWGS